MLLITTLLGVTALAAPVVGVPVPAGSFATGFALLVATPLAVEVLAVMGALIGTIAPVTDVGISLAQAFHRYHDRYNGAHADGRVHTGSSR